MQLRLWLERRNEDEIDALKMVSLATFAMSIKTFAIALIGSSTGGPICWDSDHKTTTYKYRGL
jgi:hypothetical protein